MLEKTCWQCAGHGRIIQQTMVMLGMIPVYKDVIIICPRCSGSGKVFVLSWW